ncbi:MAG: heat-inducible transcriptional repressor HrcA [Candidatus Omnitrophica bacterium]|nr:heat-inducible transcriptional repressor HrcA [Candidatus Omnitrophota bacterium]
MRQEMNQRQRDVFELIVKNYVETAEPVGSRFVSRKLGLSSATIRNVMSDLEEMGLVTHPHTSAGRIPTDKGYRYYIDSLMRVRSVNESVLRSIREEYHETMRSIEDVLIHTSHIISNLTNYVGLTLTSQNDRLYLDGTSHIITQPEFQDLKKLYYIIRFLEQKRQILNLLHNDLASEDLRIHIGKENQHSYLSECSIVTKGYKSKGKVAGRVGVIGPKRMLYEKVIPTVEVLADTMTGILDNLD